MKSKYAILIAALFAIILSSTLALADDTSIDSEKAFKERIKQSLVNLSVTTQDYSNYQPWKPNSVSQRSGYGVAVAPYQVLTTAWNMRDATFVKAKVASQNEFIPAKVMVLDYQSNLCLLSLDPGSLAKPLTPLTFTEDFDKGDNAVSYWLTSAGHVKTGRGILDRAEVNASPLSIGSFLDYVVANSPSSSGKASLYCINNKAVGLAHWAEAGSKETGLIPGVVINKFLTTAAEKQYKGFPIVGFAAKKLIDPATRKFLKMPDDLKDGVYVAKVYNLGTGCKELRKGDCILAIDGNTLDPYGKFAHPTFEKIVYHHLISGHKVGDKIKFTVWRKGEKLDLDVVAKAVDVDDMLVNYHEYDKQPEYVITGGYVIQKLTRPYLMIWGDGWTGKCPPHLYSYYRNQGFNPTDQREDVVVLSFVMPAEINQGYHALGRQVITKINGKKIKSIKDVPAALKAKMMSKFTTIEFEHDYPTVVIDRSKLEQADMFISKVYGVEKLKNIRED